MTVEPRPTFMNNAGITLAGSSAESTLMPAGYGVKTIPAGQLYPGKYYVIEGEGVFSTLLVPGSFTTKVKLNSTVLASVVLNNILASANNNAFEFKCKIACRTVGTAGTIVISGGINYAIGANTRGFADFTNSGLAITINTTIDQIIDVTGQWGIASASNSITVNTSTIEQLSFV